MKNSKHTPGPWTLIKTDRNDFVITYQNSIAKSHICTCHDFALAEEHGSLEANARLIAAAPDLLEAIKGTIECLRKPELLKEAMQSKLGLEGTIILDLLKIIAKAEGNK